jgi:4-hydroxy-tetrahydrodipicolinate reductase
MPTRVMVVGLGPVGASVARRLAVRKDLKVVAAVDADPATAGLDLGDVVGLGTRTGVRVGANLAAATRKSRPQVAVLSTGSVLREAWPLVEAVLKLKVPIVSTTEELAYPWFSNERLARKIDAAAKKAKVAVVGAGLNPGFAMDALPVALTAMCERVEAVRVDRVEDARARSGAFLRRIGAGLTAAEFAEQVKALAVRHVGLAESVAMIADAAGFDLDRITDEIQPKIAEAPVDLEAGRIGAGQVSGIVQDGVGSVNGRPVVALHLEVYVGAAAVGDRVQIEGSPRIDVSAAGGYPADVATASIVVNTIPKVLAAPPGLHTMRTLALPSFARGR